MPKEGRRRRRDGSDVVGIQTDSSSQPDEQSSLANPEARKLNDELFGQSISFRSTKRQRADDDETPAEGQSNKNPPNPYGKCPNVAARYEKLNRIGEGTYGVVYRARDKETNEIVALKRCLPHHEASDGFPLTTLREINTLRELSMQNNEAASFIVKLTSVAVSSSRSGVFLVFEYCEHDLATLVDTHYSMHKKSPFREVEVKRLTIQLLSALDFLHSRCLIHRDIKLSNLLYNHRGELKVADFGLARRVSRSRPQSTPLTPKVVSLWYRPPELLLGSEYYDESVDNWGAACVIGELLLGIPLMKGTSEMDQLSKVFELLGPPTSQQWPELYEMPLMKDGSVEIPSLRTIMSKKKVFIQDRFDHLPPSGIVMLINLLHYNRKSRWTAAKALQSDYFSKDLPAPTKCSLMPKFPSQHL